MTIAQSPEAVAARLVAWLREREPFPADAPLPIETLLARLDLLVSQFDPRLFPDTLGYLEPGEDVIFVRAGLTEAVRRFTLAHELGHVALHRRAGQAADIGGTLGDPADEATGDGCDGLDLEALADDGDETLRPGQAYSARAQREGEANAFAAALLLPAATTRATYEALCARGVERPALALARALGVSEDAALRRLTALLTTPTDTAGEAETEAPRSAVALDGDQRRAAHAQTPALIVAGPGSGKTSALLARIAHLRDDLGVAPERILALTFSRKAADELSARAALAAGLAQAGPRVSTIHAFCGDLLRQYGPLVGLRADYRLLAGVEGYFLLRRLVSHAPLSHYTPLSGPTRHFGALLGAISRAKDDLVTPEGYRAAATAMRAAADSMESRVAAERALEVATIYANYQAALAARGDVDYGDLIMKVVELLRAEPEVADDLRQRHQHILVDEFQDINGAMGALLRELAGARGAIWAVGDVDQAIYRFRGGSPASMLRFTQDYVGARIITLAKNYRSRPPILRAADAFASAYLAEGERVASQPMRPAATDGQAVTLAVAPDAEAELDGLAGMMRERAAAGVPLREQAVLLRTRENVKQVCAGLRLRGIPAQLAMPLFEQPQIKTLLATVSLAADPTASGLLRAGEAPDHAFGDADVRRLLRLAHEQRVTPFEALGSEPAAHELTAEGLGGLRRLEHIIAELRAAPTVAVGMNRYVFSLTGLGRRLLAGAAEGEAAAVARLIAMCRACDDLRAATRAADGLDPAPLADWAGLLDYTQAARILNLDAGAVALAEGEDAALVMTAHAAKGLEFTAVYLPQLTKGRFPKTGQRSEAPAPPGLLSDDEDDPDERLRDEANLFYVSLTRARETLTLSYGPRRGRAAPSPSPFLSPVELALGDTLARLRWEADATPRAEVATAAPAPPASTRRAKGKPRVVSINELDTYARCPQQYAYHYVYGLRPALAAPVSLNEAYKVASAEVMRRFEAGEPPTLEEALALFEERWRQSRADAQRAGDAEADDDELLATVYQAHGRRALERLWRALR
ncbi:MAG: UvrD-helicase domain-containing protein, partial [Chloroflexota bacterium]|nr:UvrD-helicase domain-containing protein [Chloroflexota bacterium]